MSKVSDIKTQGLVSQHFNHIKKHDEARCQQLIPVILLGNLRSGRTQFASPGKKLVKPHGNRKKAEHGGTCLISQ
jgi:hypothetical protein